MHRLILLLEIFLFVTVLHLHGHANTKRSDDVKWYQPRLKRGFHPETMIVKLIGRTVPNAAVSIDIENIFIIRNDGKDKNAPLNEIKSKSLSNSNGIFSLVLELPLGFSQVPVIVNNKRILLTLDVSAQTVKTNVKITRIKKNEVKLPSEMNMGIGLGAAFNSFKLDYDKSAGSGNIDLSELSAPHIYFGSTWIKEMWSAEFSFETTELETPNQIDGKSVNGDISGIQMMTLVGGYRLKRLPDSYWIKVSVSQLTQPYLGESDSNLFESQKISSLRLGLGLGKNGSLASWTYFASTYVNYPFSLSVPNGALNLEPTVFFSGEIKLLRALTKKINWGVQTNLIYDAFDYRLVDSKQFITNDGSGQLLTFRSDFLLNYVF